MSSTTQSRMPVAPSKMSRQRLTRNSPECACVAWIRGTNHTSANEAFAASLVTTTGAEAADGRDDPNREPRLWGLVDTARLRLASPQSAARTRRRECAPQFLSESSWTSAYLRQQQLHPSAGKYRRDTRIRTHC